MARDLRRRSRPGKHKRVKWWNARCGIFLATGRNSPDWRSTTVGDRELLVTKPQHDTCVRALATLSGSREETSSWIQSTREWRAGVIHLPVVRCLRSGISSVSSISRTSRGEHLWRRMLGGSTSPHGECDRGHGKHHPPH
jgi:hypothetical protein